MINDDVWEALQKTMVTPDVILMSAHTFEQCHRETIEAICEPDLAKTMLRRLPDNVKMFGIQVEVSDTVKGFELI